MPPPRSKARPPVQASLLDEGPELSQAPNETPVAAGTSLQVRAGAGRPLSPVARAFNRELARIERLRQQTAEMEALCRAHQLAAHGRLEPLRQERVRLMAGMVNALLPWLEDPTAKGLTKLQRHTATDIVCSLAEELAKAGDAAMAELHDRISPQTLEQKRQDMGKTLSDMVGSMFADLTGEDLKSFGDDPEAQAAFDSGDPEAMLRAAMARMDKIHEAERVAREEKRAARQAKRGLSKAQAAAQQAQFDADAALRQIYRQLASALHPDREPDEAERARKNGLMGEANAAYERKDLVALLELQGRAELTQTAPLGQAAEERLKALTLLLKQQAGQLETERQMAQARWTHDLELPWGTPLNAAYLARTLDMQEEELRHEIRSMAEDLEATADRARLKTFLNDQRRLNQRAEKMQSSLMDDPFF